MTPTERDNIMCDAVLDSVFGIGRTEMTDELTFAPKGAKPAKGSADKRRCRTAVSAALGDLRHSMDVSLDDVREDANAWNRILYDLTDLMFRAYARNHDLAD